MHKNTHKHENKIHICVNAYQWFSYEFSRVVIRCRQTMGKKENQELLNGITSSE